MKRHIRPVVKINVLILALAANSMDTVAVQAALFADVATEHHAAALTGGFASAAALAALARRLMTGPDIPESLMLAVERARPWLLVVIGLLLALFALSQVDFRGTSFWTRFGRRTLPVVFVIYSAAVLVLLLR